LPIFLASFVVPRLALKTHSRLSRRRVVALTSTSLSPPRRGCGSRLEK
jgi:hypothetical protein